MSPAERCAGAPAASVFVLWQSLVVESYRSFFAHLARVTHHRVALFAPRRFRELSNQEVPCAPFSAPFRSDDPETPCFVSPALVLHVQAVFFPRLGRALRRFFAGQPGPKVLLCIAEPYSPTALAAWCTARLVLGREVVFVCCALQNIRKPLPLPLARLQAFMFERSAAILATGQEQEQVLRHHGYPGRVIRFPLWFDSSRFRPGSGAVTGQKVVLGYAGGLTGAKGVLDLLACCEANATAWADRCELRLCGAGALAPEVEAACARLRGQGLDARLLGALRPDQVVELFQRTDLLVVPSRTTPGWKEQFGRVIVEARACGAVALGSSSGEIPHVIADPERIFAEGDLGQMGQVIERWCARLQDPLRRVEVRAQEAARAQAAYSDRVLALAFAEALADLTSGRPTRLAGPM